MESHHFPYSKMTAKGMLSYSVIEVLPMWLMSKKFFNLWLYSYVDINFAKRYTRRMKKLTRAPYNTTLNTVLLKKLKVLAAEQEKRHNDLLKEAIADILKKY